MRALDRKVLRDLGRMWSQAVTIALVVASGIGGFVGCLSAVESLSLARERFYETGRFGDVFASVKRAPEAQARRLAEIAGVVDVQTTVEAGARITVPDSTEDRTTAPTVSSPAARMRARPDRSATTRNATTAATTWFRA